MEEASLIILTLENIIAKQENLIHIAQLTEYNLNYI